MTAQMIASIAERIHHAQRLLFITGAGISADSGLPTYRGIGGLYNDTLTQDDIPIEVALSGDMLSQRPEVTWKYLIEIERACRQATFNKAHEIIAHIEQEKPGTWVLTQNIDGFHRAAGSRNLIEIHGRFSELFCTQCEYSKVVEDYHDLEIPPTCPQCHSLVRPNIVLFGEMLPESAVHQLYQELFQGFDMVFSIGTSSVFPYITQPILLAKQQGIPTVEINPASTDISHLVDYKITGGAAESLTQLWAAMHDQQHYVH